MQNSLFSDSLSLYISFFLNSVDPSQLNDHVNLCRSVFGCCIAEVGLHIHFKEIIPYMAGRNMLTADEVYQLTDKPVSKSEKALYLTLYILPLKGILLTPISLFYSCLVESAATEDGLQSHYYLAQILRRSGESKYCTCKLRSSLVN